MDNPSKQKSSLAIHPGENQPPAVNTRAISDFRKRGRKKYSVEEFIEGILSGNRTILSRAITLVESSLPADQEKALEIVEKCWSHAGQSIRVGITGVPGVGKSTFIEALGKYVIQQGHRLAVLAIDPSSKRSKGSILGDKTRMERLAADPCAYIRPSPSGGTLGGVARKTRETMILCEAAGYDVVFIETVGVGQSETAVHSMTDYFLLLMLPGAGDELQGIKRGIMEMADGIAITKADGNNIERALLAKQQLENALHLFPVPDSGVPPLIIPCSAIENKGISEIWDAILHFISATRQNGYFKEKRKQQNIEALYDSLFDDLRHLLLRHPALSNQIKQAEQEVMQNKISGYAAARRLLSFLQAFLHANLPEE